MLFIFFITSTGGKIVYAQADSRSFWEDAEVEFYFGTNNFHGDFDRLNRVTGDNEGAPFPAEGYHLGLALVKPLGIINSPRFQLNTTFGTEFVAHESKTVTTGLPVDLNQVEFAPTNLENNSFGLEFKVGLEYMFSENWAIEPFIGIAGRFHNPKTDGFIDEFNNGNAIITTPPGVRGDGSFKLEDKFFTRTDNERGEVSDILGSGSFGFRLSRRALGNNNLFLEYKFLQFFDDFFDNTSAASLRPNGPNNNDSMTLLSFGVNHPLKKGRDRFTRVDADEAERKRQIEELVDAIQTEEDLKRLQELMSDKILLYDTPGVHFNELAAKAEPIEVELRNTGYNSQMVSLPGGSFIMGLNAVDELNIQPQGRKRITVNSFAIDKYEVTNREYRIFLISIGALEPPEAGGEIADTVVANLNLQGPNFDYQQLLENAELTDYQNHFPAPDIDSPEDLLPDSTKWKEMGLDNVVSWHTYFNSAEFANHPVVCVNWYEAKLYAAWAGRRLPTESEWEFAARSGISGRIYPWDGLDVQTKTGSYKANFKQGRGIFKEDGYAVTAPVNSFLPNDFGLYNMAGNVSEWVLDSYNPSYVVLENIGTTNFVTPSYTDEKEPRKVHRGGSWQSMEFFIGVGVRNFQNKVEGTPFIGFRTAKN